MKKKNYIEKFRKFLNKNMVIIDFISKIVFGICSLILVIAANNLTKDELKLNKDQLNLSKNQSAPFFFLSKSNDIKGYDNLYKLENKGGKVYHLQLERIDVFNIQISKLTDRMVINYYSDFDEDKNNKNNVWYYSPKQKYVSTFEFYKKALKDLKKRYPNEYINITIPESYYKITYHDYQNIYREDYYDDHGEYISFNKNLSETGLTEFKNDSNFHTYSGMLARYDSDEELYDKFIKSIYYCFDKYISYKNQE